MSNVALIPDSLPCGNKDRDSGKDSVRETVISRYRALRLAGLEQSPEAFTSKHADELLLSQDAWLARVLNPIARTFVVLGEDGLDTQGEKQTQPALETDTPFGDDQDALSPLLEKEWLGMLTLVGPVFPDESQSHPENILDAFLNLKASKTPQKHLDTAALPSSTISYMLNSMIVLCQARRRGYGRRLIEQAAGYALTVARKTGVKRLALILTVETENEAARRLYRACGFDVTRERLVLRGMEVAEMQRWIDC